MTAPYPRENLCSLRKKIARHGTNRAFRCPHYASKLTWGSQRFLIVSVGPRHALLLRAGLQSIERSESARRNRQADRIACLSKQLPPQVLLRSSIEVFSAAVSTRHWTGHKPNSTDAAQDETNDTQSRASTAQGRGRLRSPHSSSRVHGCGLALAVRRPQRASTGTVSTGRDADGRAGARGA